LIMARRLTYEGAHVKMVLNRSHFSGGLKRNIVQCLDDYGIPLRLSHTITAVHGRARLEGVDVAQVDPKTKKPIPGTEEFVPCDTLLLSVGLLPENELTRAAGIQMDRKSNGAVVDENLATSAPGVFACGNVLHIHDLVDFVSEEGDRAGAAAAAFLAAGAATGDRATCVRILPGKGVGYVVPQLVHPDAQGNIVFRFRSRDVFRKATVTATDQDGNVIRSQKRPVILPAEMEQFKLAANKLEGVTQMTISLDAQEVGVAIQGAAAAASTEPVPEGCKAYDIVCISCPTGCPLHVVVRDGAVESVSGNSCRRGVEYAKREVLSPMRIVTSLVDVRDRELPASCRTASPVPKELIPNVIAALREVELEAPVRRGDIIYEDVCGTGVDVIATKDVD
ncbi:MAG: DUF1667 domain-containing protein, partial [Coriobacteriales bacterium]|nr:DUF1667 domain-containing protein [Coriobacteriales bacterium]